MVQIKRVNEYARRLMWFLHNRLYDNLRRNLTYELVWRNAAEESAAFIAANFDEAVILQHRRDLWSLVLGSLPPTGELIEVGVFQGVSVNFIADSLTRRSDQRLIHGFDAFEGLQENWSGEGLSEGHFDQGGRLPPVRTNVRLHKGWVQNTLAPFLAERKNPKFAMIHIDTDTYTPAHYVLETLRPLLDVGTVIVFDELIGYPNWQAHEFRALSEVISREDYQFIAFTSRQAAIRMTSKPKA